MAGREGSPVPRVPSTKKTQGKVRVQGGRSEHQSKSSVSFMMAIKSFRSTEIGKKR